MVTGGRQVQYNKVHKPAASKPKQNRPEVNQALDQLNQGKSLIDVLEWVYFAGYSNGVDDER
jgi:hypothetical protein